MHNQLTSNCSLKRYEYTAKRTNRTSYALHGIANQFLYISPDRSIFLNLDLEESNLEKIGSEEKKNKH
ncbi:hypothetical protein BC939DRAFT_455879 [Gamsiella multidivaricata]|uniref:uncharacterized protein n=1 Tax=Gamsiella multidivaricata TaxID=101098 RepID=UPI00221F4387|nr:uncharacterized protein BC939DRAFT_455879 [Gamsiella multidivaricata]KAI7821395.1 hypothetical protein BC939DRAFT_455879 [Gamsiella multidivaricata]